MGMTRKQVRASSFVAKRVSCEAQVVVFRKWRHCDDIIALFPELPSDLRGWYCDSYEHVGQHGAADYRLVVLATTPARPEDYGVLARELTNIGYNLRPIKRASQQHHENRRQSAQQYA